MTSSIRLSLEGDDGIPLVARVYPNETDLARPEDVREVVVPPAGDVKVAVSPGHYRVSLLLPTGRTISKSCIVSAQDTDLSFDARGSLSSALGEGDSFSLQGAFSETGPSSLGDLNQMVARHVGDAPIPPVESSPPSFRLRTGRRGYGTAGRAEFVQPRRSEPATLRAASPTVVLLDGSYFRATEGWIALGQGPAVWAAARTVPIDTAGSEMKTILVDVDVIPDDWGRAWLRVVKRSGIELGALPLPWTDRASGRVAASFDASLVGRAGMDMAVLDAEMAGLLTYLDQGRMSVMPALLQGFETEEFMERRIHEDPSPLAVCVAAYAFLATYSSDRAAFWERWLAELAERNADVPDCHVVLARLRTLMRGVDRSEIARQSLEKAVVAGVPFLSIGLLMLRDMLVALAQRDPSTSTRRDLVSEVARRCDPVRLFTVLRYPEV